MDAPRSHGTSSAPTPGTDVKVDDLINWLASPCRQHLILLIGIPASGKSTLAEPLRRKGYKVLSLDAIREELFGDAAVQAGFKQVIAKFYRRLYWRMRNRERIVIDATSVRYHDRQNILRKAGNFWYEVTLVVLDVPLAVALERNRRRDRHVPEEVIRSLHRELKGRGWPRRHEGRLVVLRPGKDAEDLRLQSVREAPGRG
jgi:predicted kinase